MGNSNNFTVRDEANALTALAFRNSYLEDLHSGKHAPILDDPTISRITDAEMKRLMIETSAALARLLELKAHDPLAYIKELERGTQYTYNWVRDWPVE